MIPFFRKIRQKLLINNKLSKYLLYAIGEIVLVVVGILIALQVNNWNIENTNRKQEEKYLKNILLDLEKDLGSLDYLIKFREERIAGDKKLISQMNGAPIEDLTELSYNICNTIMEERFTPNNNTYSELSSSGNLNLISNDSIKILLLDLENIYKVNEFNIAHESFDYREYISKPVMTHIDIDRLFPILFEESTADKQGIKPADLQAILSNRTYKNGVYLMSKMSEFFLDLYRNLYAKSSAIIELIEKDLADR